MIHRFGTVRFNGRFCFEFAEFDSEPLLAYAFPFVFQFLESVLRILTIERKSNEQDNVITLKLH